MDCERAAMPAHDRGRLHDPDTLTPFLPETGEQHPQESVGAAHVRPLRCGPLEDGELVPQGENLDFKLRSRTDSGANGGEERNQNGAHVRVTISARATNRTKRPYRSSDHDSPTHATRSGLADCLAGFSNGPQR